MFYSGIGLFGVGFLGLILSNIILSAKSKKLKKLMYDEYELPPQERKPKE